ncbi:MAG: response regulator [Planctomycetaceae bacterium]|nr:response regulator [Planctomycetaceae bacterium]
MHEIPSLIYVVDDDADSRESLLYLLQTVGLTARAFSSAAEFLQSLDIHQPGCLVCDVRMPGMSGLDLFEKLTAAGSQLPVIFITAYADVPMAVRALKSGAAEFIEKPFHAQTMLERIQRALATDRQRREEVASWSDFQQRLESLTEKERETLAFVRDGAPNKAIAMRLSITERAVEMRRASLMKKLQAHSLAELIRLVTEAEIHSEHRSSRRTAPGSL